MVAIVDDDESIRGALHGLMKAAGFAARAFASAEEYLNSGEQKRTACLIADIRMPGMSGLELQSKLNLDRHTEFLSSSSRRSVTKRCGCKP